MLSMKSFFNPTLYKKNVTRFWPIWAIYLAIWVVALPANLLVNYQASLGVSNSEINFAAYIPLELMQGLGIPLTAVMSIFAAMAVFSYLCNSRSVGMIHSLPIRREGLFVTNYLSGLSFFVLPNLLVYLLTLLAEAVCGDVNVGVLSIWLLGMTLLPLFFYSFGVFCSMFTGHLLALPAFYGVLNWLEMILSALIGGVLSSFVYGYSLSNSGSSLLELMGQWFTPFYMLYVECAPNTVWNNAGTSVTVDFSGLPYLFLYAGIGILFAVAALLLYRRRRMERAGDVVTVTPLRPVFKYGFAFCAALSLGLLLYSIFEYSMPNGVWTLLGFMLLCGAIGYFAAEMLLQKSFRVFSRWKGCVVFLLCLTVATAAMEFDLFGYERKVPSADEVASVTLTTPSSAPYDGYSYATITLTDPALIEQLIAIHEEMIAQKATVESIDALLASGTTMTNSYFSFSYILKNGQTITRGYNNILITAEDLQNPDSYASRLQALASDPAVTMTAYFSHLPENAVLSSTEITYFDKETYSVSSMTYGTADTTALYEAVCADLSAGNLGQRYLLDSEERYENCYYNDITFTFSSPETDYSTPYGTVDAYTGETFYTVTITLQSTAVNTLALLGDMKDGLLTMEEYNDLTESGMVDEAYYEKYYQ